MDKIDIRNKRDTSYSMTQKLIKTLGEEEVMKTWQKLGMYKAAEELTIKMNEYVSPSTLRNLSNLYNWKRNCNPKSPMYKGVVINKYYSSSLL